FFRVLLQDTLRQPDDRTNRQDPASPGGQDGAPSPPPEGEGEGEGAAPPAKTAAAPAPSPSPSGGAPGAPLVPPCPASPDAVGAPTASSASATARAVITSPSCRASGSKRPSSVAGASPPGARTTSIIAKCPRRMVEVASSKLHPSSNNTRVTPATIPGRSLPIAVTAISWGSMGRYCNV